MGTCLEDQAIADAYLAHLKTLNPYRPNKRRKGSSGGIEDSQSTMTTSKNGVQKPEEPISTIDQDDLIQQNRASKQAKRRRLKGQRGIAASEEEALITSEEPKTTLQSEEQEKGNANKEVVDLVDSPSIFSTSLELEAESRLPKPTSGSTQQTSTTNLAFYLNHPSLPSKHPVLIPLPPDATLGNSLTNRLVLEFPTIYVLPQQEGGRLPETFIKEDDYFASAKKEWTENATGLKTMITDVSAVAEKKKGGLEEGEVDESRLLEVLGKDLKGVTAPL